MSENFRKVQNYIFDLNLGIKEESEEELFFVINDEDNGITNLTLIVDDPILVMEQFLFELKDSSAETLISILQKNREIIHGAMVLDESGTKVLFRDTLQISNLDLNELEASINSLSMLLSEYSGQILQYAKV